MVNKNADIKIMQMSFMVIFVFIFFTMVFLFFIVMNSSKMYSDFNILQKESALSSIETISNMPELNCNTNSHFCIDKDKITAFMQVSSKYEDFLPVSHLRIRKIYPENSRNIRCPAENCTYYEIINKNAKDSISRGLFVSICKVEQIGSHPQKVCEIGMLDVGMQLKSPGK